MTAPRTTTTRTFLRMLRQARPYWPHLLGILLLELAATPLALLMPVALKIVIDMASGHPPLPGWLAAVVPTAVQGSKMGLLWLAIALAAGVTVLAAVRSNVCYILSTYSGGRMTLEFRGRLLAHAQRLSVAFHDQRGTADSLYRIQYDAQGIQWVFIYGIGQFLNSTLMFVTALLVIWRISGPLALVALTVTPLLVYLSNHFKNVNADRYRQVQEQESTALAVVQEVLSCLRVVKAFGREQDEERRFHTRSDASLKARTRLAGSEGLFGVLLALTTAAGSGLVLYLGGRSLIQGRMSPGDLYMVMSYLVAMYAPLEQITRKVADFQYSMVSVQRALELVDETPDVPDNPRGRPIAVARGRIAFQQVAFAYRGDKDHPVLRGVSFTAEPGQTIGIVGATGSGKSTLMSLLLRFYDPVAGAILLDGTDLRDYRLADLRNQFSIVLQEPVLFASSVAENIAYSRPGATPQQIQDAARAANAHDFIERFPQGYQTEVGERGMRLSGGERQRISIARAFLKDAPVLILDEPTSSVDVQTEARIVEAMQRLMKGRTAFLITHRPSTLRFCDRVLAVENGTVREKTVQEAMAIAQ